MKHNNNIKHVVKGVALLLCVFFFVLPLVQCSKDSSINASAYELATGTGDLFPKGDPFITSSDGFPAVFILLIIPILLLIMGLSNSSYASLGTISILGLIAKIIFIVIARNQLNSGEMKGAFELTSNNWIIIGIYFLLVILTLSGTSQGKNNQHFYSNKVIIQDENINDYSSWKCPRCSHLNPNNSLECRKCEYLKD